jgi:hypothetical protein
LQWNVALRSNFRNELHHPKMPSHQTVERFVELVEAGKGIDALDKFYAENASMQENQAQPRLGKAALLAHETAAQASATGMTARCVRPILIEGEIVVIRWAFDYVDGQGRAVHFQELAYQRWVGDSISEEQFFYDPAQFKSREDGIRSPASGNRGEIAEGQLGLPRCWSACRPITCSNC